jgi:hypothetical protein
MGSEIETGAVGRTCRVSPAGSTPEAGEHASSEGSSVKTLSPFHSVAVSRTLKPSQLGLKR